MEEKQGVTAKPQTPKTRKPRKPRTPKVKEVEVKGSDIQEPQPRKQKKNLFPVYVRGALRHLTKFGYDAVKKDPGLEVQLPEGSPFLEEGEKGCKDC